MAWWRLFLAIAMLCLIGVAFWWFTKTKPSAPYMRLTVTRFSDLPGWAESNPQDALSAFARSCSVIAHLPPTAAMTGLGYAGNASDWQPVCRAIPAGASSAQARLFFETNFAPVQVSAATDNEATFTGYYEPLLRGSRKRHGAYRVPVYGTPDNLVSGNLKQFGADLPEKTIVACLEGRHMKPCPTRAQIDSGQIDHAPVLFYSDDPVAVFFLEIQGSGRARLDDGSSIRVIYDAQNGSPYTAIGRVLVAGYGVPRAGMSMQVIRAWLHAHPADAQRVMETDKSYVFFREAPIGDDSIGADGSEGVPLTAGASLAVDTKFHPMGVPVYVATTRPGVKSSEGDYPFDRLLVAQDTGGAIRGAARGDVFWGFGKDSESIAGRMKSTGQFFLLLPKKLVQGLSPYKDYSAAS